MTQIYEGMFLLSNDVVREDWKTAKSVVTGALEKHGGEVVTARRWDERRLAYPIRGRRRATYLLTYYRMPGEAFPAMRRDFDLNERVLRYLMLSVDGVPEGELELAEAENAADFQVPPPPPDDAPEPEPESRRDSGDPDSDDTDDPDRDSRREREPARARRSSEGEDDDEGAGGDQADEEEKD